jgi:hypothetical protein
MGTTHLQFHVVTLLICALVSAWPAEASGPGGLYGTVRQHLRPVSGLDLELACPGFVHPDRPPPSRPPQMSTARTDLQGAFTFRALPVFKGRCELRARGHSAKPLEVFVSDSSLKYDLELDNLGNLRER